MRSKGQSQSMLVRIIMSPIRALGKAKDLYVRSITNCGGNMNYGSNTDAAGRFAAFPRSYSTATSRSDDGEDFRELMRAASARTMVNKIDMDLALRQQQQQQMSGTSKGLPFSKSSSVGMGRIDEDKACEFGEPGAFAPDLYPRSRSYAVGKRPLVF
ncbi:hypothetical protein L6164_015526 [Bauhinia variegata]|uniref:Uncharacterized protein n=1 Tax=Bauhinia variegata TaxID=167791 RepID=A0ACB9NLW7_BAUVA|nr:hypothetical protein L6164_015526 [Bauhinia variegata]